jgi:hypothetical protein
MIDILVLSAIVLGLTQLFKVTTNVTARWIPISALLITFGILGLYTYTKGTPMTWEIIENGIIVALGSVGMWSGVKSTSGN